MACAFKIRFWEMFNAPRTCDILTDNQYKLPNSNDGCMQLRAPTTCPKWNEGMEEDEKVLHWLSQNAGLSSECVTEVIEPFTRRRSENAISGKTWNEAAKHAAVKQVTQPHHTTSSTSCQGSRVDYCPITRYIRAVYTARSIV